jgi:hypothetical protein
VKTRPFLNISLHHLAKTRAIYHMGVRQSVLRLSHLGYLPAQRGSLMFFSPIIAPWIDLSMKAGHLAFETQALVGLRLFRMATGTVASARRNATHDP